MWNLSMLVPEPICSPEIAKPFLEAFEQASFVVQV